MNFDINFYVAIIILGMLIVALCKNINIRQRDKERRELTRLSLPLNLPKGEFLGTSWMPTSHLKNKITYRPPGAEPKACKM